MSKTTFWDLIERTLEKVGTPLSAKEIWEKANELGTIGDFITNGKTPWATIGTYCYTAINSSGDNSIIIQTSERPAQFFLRRLSKSINLVEITEKKEEQKIKEEKRLKRNFTSEIFIPF